MISPSKLIKMAKKWQRVAIMRRKRISFPASNKNEEASTSCVDNKGHFVVYTSDQRRFTFPLSYLENPVIRELLEKSEEEFGLPRDGPIRLPCDATFMQQVVSMIQGSADSNLDIALPMSITTQRRLLFGSLEESRIKHQVVVSVY